MPTTADQRSRSAASGESSPTAPPHPRPPFQEVRTALLRAAADKQSNDLTERIEKDFLGTAAGLISERCAHQGAALETLITALLAVACLLNAPVGFLDRILSLPWMAANTDQGSKHNVEGDEERRRYMLNLPLQTYLLDAVLDFVYQPDLAVTLPPLLRCTTADNLDLGTRKPVTRELVAAVLDGGTPLHFAAACGAIDQVNWLLANGADLRARTHAGEVPIQLVPKCEDAGSCSSRRHRDCNCSRMGTSAPGACTSDKARASLARQGMRNLSSGVWAWLKTFLASLLCLLGIWGCYASLSRPGVEVHADHMAADKRADARKHVTKQIQLMRDKAHEARQHLQTAMATFGPLATRFDLGEPGGDTAMTRCWQGEHTSDDPIHGATDHYIVDPLRDPQPKKPHCNNEDASSADTRSALNIEELLRCSLDTVHILQDFALKPVELKWGESFWMDLPRVLESQCTVATSPNSRFSEADKIMDCEITASDQAEIFLLMAQAVAVVFRAQGCPTESAKLANVRMGIAYDNGKVLFSRVERHPERYPGKLTSVATAFVRILHANICLLLATQARRSATPSIAKAASQLLQRWDDMAEKGFVVGAGLQDDMSVACLRDWCRTASADLQLAAALKGYPLSAEESLEDILGTTVTRDSHNQIHLKRPLSREAVLQLKKALIKYSASASAFLVHIFVSAAENSAAEVAAAEALLEATACKGGQTGARTAIDSLDHAIRVATRFPRLQEDVMQAKQLQERWEERARAASKLESEVQAAKQPVSTPLPQTAAENVAFWKLFNVRLANLAKAIAAAQMADIPVSTAKKVQNEMKAQVTAAELSTKMKDMLDAKPCGSAALRAAVQKAESAASNASSHSAGGHSEGLQQLQPVLQAAKRQLEIERTAEVLQRAVASSKTLGDLPRLEAAILTARKTGDIAPDILKSANDVRASLDAAAKSKASLESAIKGLSRSHRVEDAEAVEAAINSAQADASLLAEEIKAAQAAVAHWRALTASKAKLTRALREGAGSTLLARAVQEALSAGVKDVGKAQRVLKATQNLETAMQRAEESRGHVHLLRDRISAAESAGISQALLHSARQLEMKLLFLEAKCDLELALKPRSDRSEAARSGALKAALEKVDVALSGGATDSYSGEEVDEPQVQMEEETRQALQRMAAQAQEYLAEEAKELERIEQVKAEEQRLKLEKQKADREEREKERRARAEQSRLERDRLERERADKKEADRAERLLAQDRQRNGQDALAEAATCKQMRPSPKAPIRMPLSQSYQLPPQPSLVQSIRQETGWPQLSPLLSGGDVPLESNGSLGGGSQGSRPASQSLSNGNGNGHEYSLRFSLEVGSHRQPSPAGSAISANSSGSNTPGAGNDSAWSRDQLSGGSAPLPPRCVTPDSFGNPTGPAWQRDPLVGGSVPLPPRCITPESVLSRQSAKVLSRGPDQRSFFKALEDSHAPLGKGVSSTKEFYSGLAVSAALSSLETTAPVETAGKAVPNIQNWEASLPCSHCRRAECSNGSKCNFAPSQQPLQEPMPAAAPLLPKPAPPQAVTSGAGALAFGAPGLNAFSNWLPQSRLVSRSSSANQVDVQEMVEEARRYTQSPAAGAGDFPAYQPSPYRGSGLNGLDLAGSRLEALLRDSNSGVWSGSGERAEPQQSLVGSAAEGGPSAFSEGLGRPSCSGASEGSSSALGCFSRLDGLPHNLDEILQSNFSRFDFISHSQPPSSS